MNEKTFLECCRAAFDKDSFVVLLLLSRYAASRSPRLA